MRVTVTRFEGDYAVCETPAKEVITIPRSMIPADAGEGDKVIIDTVMDIRKYKRGKEWDDKSADYL